MSQNKQELTIAALRAELHNALDRVVQLRVDLTIMQQDRDQYKHQVEQASEPVVGDNIENTK